MATLVPDPLAALAWLADAGADEAVLDAPVNRFVERTHPALEGAARLAPSASETPFPGREPLRSTAASPKSAARTSTLPDGEGAGLSGSIGAAQALAAGARTLAELKAAIESFEGCALKAAAKSTVFADGSPAAKILIIGEAPGAEEDKAGTPFVGRAGQLLDRMLAAIGLSRADNVYITNVIPWRPPGNRDPSPDEAAICLPFLRRHIELFVPELIVLLGGTAVRHVTGQNDGILRLRGQWLDYRVGGQAVPVLPALHPAYLLRQPSQKKLAWRDLIALQIRLESLGLLTPRDRTG